MHRHFDDELRDLNTLLLKMGGMAEESIGRAVQALKNRDTALANKVISDDKSIDDLELVIDEKCLDLIALRQPMANDLRFLTTAMKINAELERIADLSVDVAQRVVELSDKPHLKPLVDIPKLGSIAQNMTKDALNAYVKRDTTLAKTVVLRDKEADTLRNLVQKELIYEHMCKDSNAAPLAVPLLLTARHLERICDHATNIAEYVIYMVQAKVVRHHPEFFDNGK